MKLEKWSVVSCGSPYQAPELQSKKLHGIVDNHPRLGKDIEVTTSTIVKSEGRRVTTHSGSVYELGTIHPDYAQYLKNEGIELDEDNPVKIYIPTGSGLKRYKIATKAIHKLGDISRDKPDLCVIHSQDEENYIGNWVCGFGFIDVKFPKETTRDLTDEEILEWSGRGLAINSNPCHFVFTEEILRSEVEEV